MKNKKDKIIANEELLLNAIKSSNLKKLDELLHNDLLFIIPTGQLITKQIDMDNLRSGNMTIDDISTSEQQINLIEDNAIVSVNIHLKAKYFNQPIDSNFRYIRVWKLFGNDWKVIAGSGIQLI